MAQTELSRAVVEVNRAARSLFGTAMKQIEPGAATLTTAERAAVFDKCQQVATQLWSMTRAAHPLCAAVLGGLPPVPQGGPQILETDEAA